jgi:hypothetical protein
MLNTFVGNNFVWFHGIVEDIDDPLKLGRVRVRVFGFHTDDRTSNGIPTPQLPWASVVQPITSAANSGIGTSPTGLLCGSQVVGFFRDPGSWQDLFILGSIAGINTENAQFGLGFSDPNQEYPLFEYLNEADTPRLSRNQNLEKTIVANKKTDQEKNIPSALGEIWNEPEVPYAAKYPTNHVRQTEAGHIQEFDDTPNAERIHTYHKSGTFEEIHPDGTKVTKVVGDNVEITVSDNNVLIKSNDRNTVLGDKNIYVGKDLNVEIQGNVAAYVNGDIALQNNGNFFSKTKGQLTIVSEGNMAFISPRIDFNPSGIEATDVNDVVQITPRRFDSNGNEIVAGLTSSNSGLFGNISISDVAPIVAAAGAGILASSLIAGPAGDQGPPGPSGRPAYTVASTPPINPTSGDFWLNSDTGRFYLATDDGDSIQWIEVSYAIETSSTRKSWFLS